jgi:putative spermidine/putrescine transport system substrate-binding protein
MWTRRQVVLGSTGFAASWTLSGLPRVAMAQSHPFTFVSWGGAFAGMHKAAFVDPFLGPKKITAVIAGPPDIAKIKAMVAAGSIEWDLVVLDGRSVWRGVDEGFVEPLDLKRIPNATALRPEFVTPFGIVTSVGASVVAWSKTAFPDGGPQSWADVWDVKRFPGQRAMYNGLYWNYEVAMRAAGVTRQEVYPVSPEKMDLAFGKLKDLKPHVRAWWSTGPQPAQMLASGEVTVTSAWSGRIQGARDEGVPIDFTFKDAIAWGSHFSIVKGSPYADLCHELINYSIGLEPQTKLLDLNVYSPVLEAAAAKADDKMRKTLVMAPEHAGNLLILNDREGARYAVKYEERWNQFLLG